MPTPSKSELRARFLSVRREVPGPVRDAEATALARRLPTLAAAGQTVCAYVPVGSEPGSVAMLDALVRQDVRVLVPAVVYDADDAPLPLHWGEYRRDALVGARHGLREPPPPWLPADTVAAATVVLVPALAVDRSGTRLGRGAGFYDRTLPLADPAARLVAIVRDDELVDRLPGEPHDVAMTHALTPSQGLVRLG